MRKKFADIRIKKEREFFEKEDFREKKEDLEKANFEKKEKFKEILSFLGTVLIFGFVFYFLIVSFQKVKITIKAKPQQISFKEQILVNSKISEIDFSQKKIPGKILEFETEISENFPCTGETLKRAEGKIKLYNSYTTENEVWRKNTRFISSEGKIFLSKDQIFVPGAKIKDGKLEPSVVEVPVIAQEGGEEYNIGPSKFSVLAFRGTERFFKYWGESTEPMKGGGKVKVLSKEDIENAKKSFTEKVEKKIKEVIKEKLKTEGIVPENCFTFSVLEEKFSKNEGEACENFEIKAKVKIKTLTLKENDTNVLAENLIANKLKTKEKIFKKKINLNCEGKDFERETFSLSLEITGTSFKDLESEINELKRKIAGRSIEETKAILESMDVEGKIKIFPRFLRKIPENFDKIEIEFVPLE
jgi:hypothetical protein